MMVKEKKEMKEKIVEIWMEISKDEKENKKRKEKIEEMKMLVNRELERSVVNMEK
jgi:hypothetical protein